MLMKFIKVVVSMSENVKKLKEWDYFCGALYLLYFQSDDAKLRFTSNNQTKCLFNVLVFRVN